MKSKNKTLIIVFISIMILLVIATKTHRDSDEINNKAFITSIGIDKIDSEKHDYEITNNNIGFEPPKRFKVTFEIPKIKSENEKSSGESKSGKDNGKNIVTVEAESIYVAILKLQEYIMQKINLTHINAIIISEEIAKDEKMLKEVMDFFERDPAIPAKTSLLVSKESSAEEILKLEPEEEKLIGIYISNYYNEISTTISTTVNIRLSDISETMKNNLKTVLVPVVTKKEDKINILGSAVIRKGILVGYLDGGETERIYSIMNKVDRTMVTIKYNDYYIGEKVTNTETKMKFRYLDNKLICDVNMFFEITVLQAEKNMDMKISDQEKINELEKQTEDYITLVKNKVVEKVQKEYKADAIGIYWNLKKYEYRLWQKLKDNWDKVYEEATVNIFVDVKIRGTGLME